VIFDPREAKLEPGEVLVAPGTDPGWTPLFLSANAKRSFKGRSNYERYLPNILRDGIEATWTDAEPVLAPGMNWTRKLDLRRRIRRWPIGRFANGSFRWLNGRSSKLE
jgi:hypothetical protein